jgi:hypothetical protein
MISEALKFSLRRFALQDPGMGTIQGFLPSIQAKESWAGVAFFLWAIFWSISSSFWFRSIA